MRSNASAYIRVSQQILLLHLILLYQKYPLFKNCKDLFHDFELKVIMRVGTWLTPHTISTVHHRALTRPNLVLVKHIPTNKNKCNVKISFLLFWNYNTIIHFQKSNTLMDVEGAYCLLAWSQYVLCFRSVQKVTNTSCV